MLFSPQFNFTNRIQAMKRSQMIDSGSAKEFHLVREFAILALLAISIISIVSGSVLFRYLSQHLLERDMIVSSEFIQSVASFNDPEHYFNGSDRDEDRAEIEQFFHNITLIPDVLRATVYDVNQTIIWSDNPDLIGKRFTDNDELTTALNGDPVFAIESPEDTGKAEHEYLPSDVSEFVENYLPIWNSDRTRVIGVLELYKAPKALYDAIAKGKKLVLAVSVSGGIILFLTLFWVVRRASRTIDRQATELNDRIDQLSRLLEQNSDLRNRIQQASRRAVSTNEQFLRRVGSDLHDGPAQALGLALLRLDAIKLKSTENDKCQTDGEFENVREFLNNALKEIRTISSGLVVPELAKLTLSETLSKVVRDHKQRTGQRTTIKFEALPDKCPLPVKICAYRFVQEGLNNVFRHASSSEAILYSYMENETDLILEVRDMGSGFDVDKLNSPYNDGLGLPGLRERIESLGGEFVVSSTPNEGTRIHARMSVISEEIGYD